MSCKFTKNNVVMDVTTKKLFFIVRVKPKAVMIRNEENDEVEEVAPHYANRNYTKVDPDMVKTLYEDVKEKP